MYVDTITNKWNCKMQIRWHKITQTVYILIFEPKAKWFLEQNKNPSHTFFALDAFFFSPV